MPKRVPECGHPDRRHWGHGLCRPCYTAAWIAQNPGRAAAYSATYRARHPERVSEQDAAYKRRNRDRIAERHAAWEAEHPGHRADWDARHPGLRDQWFERHPGYANAYTSASDNKQRARRYGSEPGDVTGADLLRLRAEACAYCGLMPAGGIDHILALSRGGSNTLDNVAPCCVACNKAKGARDVDEFLSARAAA